MDEQCDTVITHGRWYVALAEAVATGLDHARFGHAGTFALGGPLPEAS